MLFKKIGIIVTSFLLISSQAWAITITSNEENGKELYVEVKVRDGTNDSTQDCWEQDSKIVYGAWLKPGETMSTGISSNEDIQYLCVTAKFNKHNYGQSKRVFNNNKCKIVLNSTYAEDFIYYGRPGDPNTGTAGAPTEADKYCYTGDK